MKKIVILGSTGSIGTQTLDIVRKNPDSFKVVALTCSSSTELMEAQAAEFGVPKKNCYVCGGTDDENNKKLIEAATLECDLVINALMGMRGLEPTYRAITAGRDVALANKETLVAGGEIIMEAVKKNKVLLLPIDSEHSAIFQCLEGNGGAYCASFSDRSTDENSNKGAPDRAIKKLILTCSGGPFRGYTEEMLEKVSLAEALRHPKWNMGKKITIDSATLMNKGLELIEARWLFDVAPDDIEVVVHPQSIVHSAVEFRDNSILAQLGLPDMRIPISLAMGYPDRLETTDRGMDFFGEASNLSFERPDNETFRCIELARVAIKRAGSLPAILNSANEELVSLFLEQKISFTDIQKTLEKVVDCCEATYNMSIEDIREADRDARKMIRERYIK